MPFDSSADWLFELVGALMSSFGKSKDNEGSSGILTALYRLLSFIVADSILRTAGASNGAVSYEEVVGPSI